MYMLQTTNANSVPVAASPFVGSTKPGSDATFLIPSPIQTHTPSREQPTRHFPR